MLDRNNWLCISKTLIKKIGLLNAILLSALLDEFCRQKSINAVVDDYFYCTRDELEKTTGLKPYTQRSIFDDLISRSLLEYVKTEHFPKKCYKINFSVLDSLDPDILSSLDLVPLTPSNIASSNIANLANNNIYYNNIIYEDTNLGTKSDPSHSQSISTPKKENRYDKCKHEIEKYANQDKDLYDALENYLRIRLSINDKPFYLGQWKGLLNKLSEICKDSNCKAIDIVKQSIDRKYASFYPVINTRKHLDGVNDCLCSDTYTEQELNDIHELSRQRSKKGERAYF